MRGARRYEQETMTATRLYVMLCLYATTRRTDCGKKQLQSDVDVVVVMVNICQIIIIIIIVSCYWNYKANHVFWKHSNARAERERKRATDRIATCYIYSIQMMLRVAFRSSGTAFGW